MYFVTAESCSSLISRSENRGIAPRPCRTWNRIAYRGHLRLTPTLLLM